MESESDECVINDTNDTEKKRSRKVSIPPHTEIETSDTEVQMHMGLSTCRHDP